MFPSIQQVVFSTSAFVLLGYLYQAKKSRYISTTKTSSGDISEFLDWMDSSDKVSQTTQPEDEHVNSVGKGENMIYRGLASLGLVPTSPRQARNVRDATIRKQNVAHPATGNDEMADEVVRVQRISEEEEVERYFSAFSYYKS